MKKILSVILLGILMILSASCSGGGGGDNDSENNNQPTTYSITGQIISDNKGVAGVTVSLGGENAAQTTTDSNGYYSFINLDNGDYTVTPSLAGFIFSPSGRVVTISGADHAGLDFAATSSTKPTYSISGTIYGTGGSGVTITLTGAATASTTTDVSGNYSLTGLADGSYTVKPSKTGYTFTPSSKNVTVSGANQTGINFTATANTTPTYAISGTVSGAVSSGVTITLTGTSTGSTTTDFSGNYSFSNLPNGNYTLTASKTGYSFSPVRSVTVNGVNITGQNFSGTANPVPTYTIFGNVSGAIQSGVTITLAGSGSRSTTTDSSGNYSFSGVTSGNYTITPSKTGYTFSPVSKTFTVSNANVTGQNFTATVSLAAYYPFTGNANDASGNGNNGTVYGATLTTDRYGNPNRAYLFNGEENYIEAPIPSSVLQDGSFTVSYWMQYEWQPHRIWVMYFDCSGAEYSGFHALINVNDEFAADQVHRGDTQMGFSYETQNRFNITALQGSWLHIATVYDAQNKTLKSYLNGGLIDEDATYSPHNIHGCINLIGHGGEAYFKGSIDEIRIYNRALSASEILDLYNNY